MTLDGEFVEDLDAAGREALFLEGKEATNLLALAPLAEREANLLVRTGMDELLVVLAGAKTSQGKSGAALDERGAKRERGQGHGWRWVDDSEGTC